MAKKRAKNGGEMGEKRAKNEQKRAEKTSKKSRFCSAFFCKNYSKNLPLFVKKGTEKRHRKKGSKKRIQKKAPLERFFYQKFFEILGLQRCPFRQI